jgi:hypothetical protein
MPPPASIPTLGVGRSGSCEEACAGSWLKASTKRKLEVSTVFINKKTGEWQAAVETMLKLKEAPPFDLTKMGHPISFYNPICSLVSTAIPMSPFQV